MNIFQKKVNKYTDNAKEFESFINGYSWTSYYKMRKKIRKIIKGE